jgi:hypothetical protein
MSSDTKTIATETLQRDACDKYWETLTTLIALVAPNKKTSLIAKVRAAKLTSDKSELPAAWDEAMAAPCTGVTYAKAFKRITGRNISLYDALAYRDKAALFDTEEGRRALGLEEYCDPSDIVFDDTNASTVWQELDNMVVYARTFASGVSFNLADVVRPSRDEIAADIKRRRAEKQQKRNIVPPSSLDEARVAMLISVFAPLHPSGSVELDDTFVSTMTTEISTDANLKNGVETLDSAVVAEIPCIQGLGLKQLTDETKGQWDAATSAVAKVDGVARMSSSIPSNVMNQIESQAAALAGGLCAGSVDLEHMDFSSIGQTVLQNCSQADVDAMTGNIGQLLPNLGQLARSLQADGGPMAGSIDSMLGAAMQSVPAAAAASAGNA